MESNSQTATLVIVSGPDRGGILRLTEEMVHVGRAADKQVVLNDPDAADHVVSLCCRGGRYALYALTDSVQVDSNPVPPERWVWLPETARIRVTSRTLLQFSTQAAAAEAAENGAAPKPAAATPPQPVPRVRGAKSPAARQAKKGGEKRESNVARFIVDQQGDTLVKLGEDGNLPELRLSEGPQNKPAERQASGANPLLVYGAVGFSFLMSILLLLLDVSPSTTTERERADARRALTEFYGDGGDLQPHQRLLREARLAHARRDYRAEERAYRGVLALLNSEDHNQSQEGRRTEPLTGDPTGDAQLRKHISVLLSR